MDKLDIILSNQERIEAKLDAVNASLQLLLEGEEPEAGTLLTLDGFAAGRERPEGQPL